MSARVVTCLAGTPAWGPSSALTELLLPQLILVASDLGQPVPYETMQPLQVALEDIDDNEPLFVRPPVSLPLPCAGHTAHCCRHTWLHVETARYFTEQILSEQLLCQGTTQQSKCTQKCLTPGADVPMSAYTLTKGA